MPKVSVIVPVYNVEKYIDRCAISILNQTFKDIEVIFVDDGSPDNCPKILDEYAKKDERVKVIHEENGGAGKARNEGLKNATGKWILFVDSDDYLVENAIENLLKCENAEMVIGSICWAYEDSDSVVKQKEIEDKIIDIKKDKEIFAKLFGERRLNYFHGKLYLRRIIAENNLMIGDYKKTFAEDTEFNFSYLQYCTKIAICGEIVSYYMHHLNNLATRFDKNRYNGTKLLEEHVEIIAEKMGFLTEEFKEEIYVRRVKSAYWCAEGIRHAKIKKKEKILALDEISSDEKLKDALNKIHILEEMENIKILSQSGAKAYLNYFKKLKLKGFLCKITPKFIRNALKKK